MDSINPTLTPGSFSRQSCFLFLPRKIIQPGANFPASQKHTMSLFAPVPSQKHPPFLGKACAPPGLPIAPLFSLKDGTSQTDSVHQNHLEGFLNPLWPKPRVSDSGDLRGVLIIYFSNKFPGDVDTAGPRTNFEKHDPKNCSTDFALLSQIPEPLPPGCFFP